MASKKVAGPAGPVKRESAAALTAQAVAIKGQLDAAIEALKARAEGVPCHLAGRLSAVLADAAEDIESVAATLKG